MLILFGFYLAFAKKLPFTERGYQLNATFENAATLRATSPVRIAGVNVGKVTAVERDGEAAKVTFTVDEEGRPLHADATIEIRPRLFLEGNFFLDLRPGQPQRAGARRRRHIPVTQTATAVQLDEVLTALQAPRAQGPAAAAQGFGTGAHLRADGRRRRGPGSRRRGRDRRPRRSTTSFALRRPGGPRHGDRQRGAARQNPHDLSGLIRAQKAIFGELAGREAELQDLITNFNIFTGALAAESANLSGPSPSSRRPSSRRARRWRRSRTPYRRSGP